MTADLFTGLGTFALSIPGKVYAAEAARDASLSLKAAAARAQRPVFVEHRDLYRRPLTAALRLRMANRECPSCRSSARSRSREYPSRSRRRGSRARTEARRAGIEGVSTARFRWRA